MQPASGATARERRQCLNGPLSQQELLASDKRRERSEQRRFRVLGQVVVVKRVLKQRQAAELVPHAQVTQLRAQIMLHVVNSLFVGQMHSANPLDPVFPVFPQ